MTVFIGNAARGVGLAVHFYGFGIQCFYLGLFDLSPLTLVLDKSIPSARPFNISLSFGKLDLHRVPFLNSLGFVESICVDLLCQYFLTPDVLLVEFFKVTGIACFGIVVFINDVCHGE